MSWSEQPELHILFFKLGRLPIRFFELFKSQLIQ